MGGTLETIAAVVLWPPITQALLGYTCTHDLGCTCTHDLRCTYTHDLGCTCTTQASGCSSDKPHLGFQ